jgi:hypothetical protein
MNPLLILLVVGTTALLLTNANKANITAATNQVLLTGIRINTSKLLSPYFELTFNIFNTVNSNLTLQAISGSIYYQGSPIASIQYANNIQIKKGDNFITVKAIPDNIAIMRQIIGIIGGKFTRDVTVQGTAIVNGIQIPIKNSLF